MRKTAEQMAHERRMRRQAARDELLLYIGGFIGTMLIMLVIGAAVVL